MRLNGNEREMFVGEGGRERGETEEGSVVFVFNLIFHFLLIISAVIDICSYSINILNILSFFSTISEYHVINSFYISLINLYIKILFYIPRLGFKIPGLLNTQEFYKYEIDAF